MGIPVNSDVSLLSTGAIVKGSVTYKPNLFAGDTFKVGQYATLDLGTITGEDTVSALTVNLGNSTSTNSGSPTINIGVIGDKDSSVGGSSTITIGSIYSMSARTQIYLGCATNSGQSEIHIGDSIDGGPVGQGYVFLGSTGSASVVYAQGALVIGNNAKTNTGCLYTDMSGMTPTLKFFNGNEWVSLGGGASGDYLPLSGGTLSGTLTIEMKRDYSISTNALLVVNKATDSGAISLLSVTMDDSSNYVTIGSTSTVSGTVRTTVSGQYVGIAAPAGTIEIGHCGDSNSNTVNIGVNDGSSGGSGATTNYVNIGNSSMEGDTWVVIGKNSGLSTTYVEIGEAANTSDTHVRIGNVGSSASSHVDIGLGGSDSATGSAFVNIGTVSLNSYSYTTIGSGSSSALGRSTVYIGQYGTTTIGDGGMTFIGSSNTTASSTVQIGVGAVIDDKALPFTAYIGHADDVSSSSEWVGTVAIGSDFRRVSDTDVRTSTTTTLYGNVVLPVIATSSGTPITSYPLTSVGQIVFDSSTNKVYISVNDPNIGSMVWKALAFVTE